MSLTANAKVYTADSFATNSVGYTGVNKTTSVKDDVVMARSPARATDTWSGLARGECKFVRTVTLTGAKTPTGDLRIRVLVDNPVGSAAADVDALCADVGAFIASADFKTHAKTGKVNY